jgi:hypothetical protein
MDYFHRRQNGTGNGQIQTGAFLPDIRRGQIYRNMFPGKGIPSVFNGRLYAVPTFFHRGIGEPHRRKLGQTLGCIYLHLYAVGIDTVYGAAYRFNDQYAPPFQASRMPYKKTGYMARVFAVAFFLGMVY